MKLYNILASGAIALAMACSTACTEDSPVTTPPVNHEPAEIERGTFAKGADVSWVTELEAKGYKFQNNAGQEKELMTLLRDDCGVNAIRLRVWVNPAEGWSNIDDVLVKARRANDLGLRLMIDFHFSDSWADPGKQNIPAAWADMDLTAMLAAIKGHVNDMLSLLQRYGIEPEWVQIGNETRTGMLWPMGDIENGDNFAQMVDAGYEAVKAVFPEATVIVHCDEGNNLWLYDNLFSRLTGARYDMIGMSLYPEPSNWSSTLHTCLANIETVQKTYGKPVMICEIGLDYREAEAAADMMKAAVDGCLVRGAKGIFWWEPEAPPQEGYNKGCFNENGEPNGALDYYKELP